MILGLVLVAIACFMRLVPRAGHDPAPAMTPLSSLTLEMWERQLHNWRAFRWSCEFPRNTDWGSYSSSTGFVAFSEEQGEFGIEFREIEAWTSLAEMRNFHSSSQKVFARSRGASEDLVWAEEWRTSEYGQIDIHGVVRSGQQAIHLRGVLVTEDTRWRFLRVLRSLRFEPREPR